VSDKNKRYLNKASDSSRIEAEHTELDALKHIANIYALDPRGAVPNNVVYKSAANLIGVSTEQINHLEPIGEARAKHSVFKRRVRWHQQTLKSMGLLERVGRGTWKLSEKGRKQLTKAEPTVAMLAFSTNLGIAIWGACERVFKSINEPITLCVTSPPYLLRTPRDYGNPKNEREYVDFILRALEPIVCNLVPGGSICLNISNDIFEQGSPARSMYCERLLLALHDRLGLQLMDRLVWESNKPPGPVQWASKNRVQLNVAYEHVYWMTNDSSRVRSDNRRVLQEHTKEHLRLIKKGGDQRNASFCDGAYTLRAGKSFSNETPGKIPRNIIKISSTCADKRYLAGIAKSLGFPVHGATMPLALAKFLIQFLTGDGEDELVVDPFGGWFRTAKAAEELGRRWISSELMLEYAAGGAEGFRASSGFVSAL
jgi:site-specific DNA-methyltransferase (cytosine-N4-specific)